MKLIDMTGQKLHRLTFFGRAPNQGKRTRWWVRCDCGTEKMIDVAHVRYGHTRSCGCLEEELSRKSRHLVQYAGQNRTHCASKTPLYFLWKAMRQRCTNPRNKDFHHYGGRGIKICERWDDFANFRTDMGERPEGMTLDRRDPDGNYEPDNCRWASWSEQNKNKRKA